MNKPDVKKLILLNLPYVFAFYFADKIAAVFRLAPGTEFIDKLTNGFAVFGTAFANPLPSFHPVYLLICLSAGVLLKLAVYVKGKNRKKFRQGEEYGSARWGKPEDIKPYMDPEFSNNVILTQTEFLTMNSRPKQPKYARNKNILVIGGSGSGKTRFFVKPNLMQMHSSYVVTDPKGTVLVECGKMLEKGGYVIKSLNTINFRKSMHYNPFSYIRSEKDILKLVNTIIVNTKGDGDKSGEDFWVKAEKLYYTALIGYIWYEAPEHEKNFTTLLELINASEAREDDETFKNPVDLMFDELEERDNVTMREDELEEVLKGMLDYAYEKGILKENSVVYRDLFDTKIMGLLMPRPSEVISHFHELYEQVSPEAATEYYYKLRRDSDYIRRYRICKDMKWVAPTKYGDLDITINLFKPEKDPKAIAAAKLAKQSGYPKCLLCRENEGYAGRVNHPARQNHRIIPVTINGSQWGFQYSPYVYYNEHCIVFNSQHVPMRIEHATFCKMFDFVKQLPH